MKSHLLAALSACALLPGAYAEEKSATAAATANVNANGQAVVTLDINGKKETKVIDLGKGSGAVTITADAAAGAAKVAAGKSTTWLGVATNSISEEVSAQLPLDPGTGLIIRHISPESPAAQAGLQLNDVLAKLDDQILANPEQLRTLLQAKKAGDSVRFTYLRKGRQAEAVATLVTKTAAASAEVGFPIINLESGLHAVGEILKKIEANGAPLTIQKKIVITPDGKITASDLEDGSTIEFNAADAIQEVLKNAGLAEDMIKNIQKAVEGAVKQSEPASN